MKCDSSKVSLTKSVMQHIGRVFPFYICLVALLFWMGYSEWGNAQFRPSYAWKFLDLNAFRPMLVVMEVVLSILAILLPLSEEPLHRLPWRERWGVGLFGIGYANILMGGVHSLLGILLPFMLGGLFLLPWKSGWKGYLSRIRSSSLRPLVILSFCFLIYILVVSLGWSMERYVALRNWRHQVWLFVVPLVLSLCPLGGEGSRRFLRISLRMVLVYLGVFLSFFYMILLMSGVNPVETLTLNKYYLQEQGFQVNFQHFLLTMGLEHYTFLGFFMLLPISQVLLSERHPDYPWAWGGLFGLLSYAFCIQSRTTILAIFLMVVCTLVYRIAKCWLDDCRSVRLASCGLLGIVMLSSVYYFISGGIMGMDEARIAVFEQGKQHLTDWAYLVQGHGLDYVEQLVRTHPLLTPDSHERLCHMHNQYLQILLESGLIGLLLWVGILGSMIYIAIRRRYYTALVPIAFWMLMMNIELLTYLQDYLIGMMIMLSSLLGGHLRARNTEVLV